MLWEHDPQAKKGKDYIQGQLYENIFAPNGGYYVYYSSNIFRNKRDLSVCHMSISIIMFSVLCFFFPPFFACTE